MMRALAAGPLTLTELDRLIADLSYPSLERRLTSMRLAGQVERRPTQRRGTPYAATDWLRRAVGPVIAAARWERKHLREQSAPLARGDVEAAFLLAVPLLRLAPDLAGTCRMVAELGNHTGNGLAGVAVRVKEGRIASCVSRLEGNADAWASGPPLSWLAALVEHDPQRLEFSGDRSLAATLVDGLHDALFGSGSLPQARLSFLT
jgi:DNA-binding HxlR family transcriptional regulator